MDLEKRYAHLDNRQLNRAIRRLSKENKHNRQPGWSELKQTMVSLRLNPLIEERERRRIVRMSEEVRNDE